MSQKTMYYKSSIMYDEVFKWYQFEKVLLLIGIHVCFVAV